MTVDAGAGPDIDGDVVEQPGVSEPGRHQQLRFEVVEAVITVRGTERISLVPSGKIRLVGGFEITSGATTIVTLGIDDEKSVVFWPGQGRH